MNAFGLVSFMFPRTLTVVAYSRVCNSLIGDREETALHRAYTNARAVRTDVTADDHDAMTLMSLFSTVVRALRPRS